MADEKNFGIDKSWIDAGLDINLIKSAMQEISELRKEKELLPKQEDVLNAIKLCPLDKVKVLIIGQDPYPSAEHAHGLAFSSLSAKTPASLKNIFKKLENDFGIKHSSNTLTCWENQGVLLLNTSLTFEGKEKKLLDKHTKLWSGVIENIFNVLKNRGSIIVMRWGNHAQKAGEIFKNGENNITVLDTTHPSPISANKGFMTSNHFKECNRILGENAIDWNVY
jgi:uracil-DNA glycosylase